MIIGGAHGGGGVEGCINVLDEHFPYVTEDAALLQTVASALPQALWHR